MNKPWTKLKLASIAFGLPGYNMRECGQLQHWCVAVIPSSFFFTYVVGGMYYAWYHSVYLRLRDRLINWSYTKYSVSHKQRSLQTSNLFQSSCLWLFLLERWMISSCLDSRAAAWPQLAVLEGKIEVQSLVSFYIQGTVPLAIKSVMF